MNFVIELIMSLNTHSSETENRIKSTRNWIQCTECDGSRGRLDGCMDWMRLLKFGLRGLNHRPSLKYL